MLSHAPYGETVEMPNQVPWLNEYLGHVWDDGVRLPHEYLNLILNDKILLL